MKGADDLLADLGAPFERQKIHWRLGSTNLKSLQYRARKDKQQEPEYPTKGIPLAYLNARDVMERLDEVLGPENWQTSYVETAKRLLCTLSIRVNGEWIGKTDGAGDTNMEGEKGGISDALKRAAVCWNVGRYLYNCENRWVDLNERGYLPDKFGQSEILAAAENAFSSPRMRKQTVNAVREALAEGDPVKMRGLTSELNAEQVQEIWRQFASNERSAIKSLLSEQAA